MFWHRHLRRFRQSTAQRRRRAALLGLTVAAALGAAPGAGQAQTTLGVATWGGAYGQAQEIALFEPFAKEAGISIATVIYDGDLAKLKTLMEGGGTPIDVVDVSASALDTLCKEGLLEPLDPSALGTTPTEGSIEEDFLPGALSACGVASMAWSAAVAFDRAAFPNGAPTSVSALLDTARFPGKRALPRTPRRSLELALLADGVPPENVYTELGTPEGADRAFAALDKIADDVLLWDRAEQPMTWLLENKVVMGVSYSGRLFRAAAGDRTIGILWDGQIYDFDAWAIPKTSDNKTEAMRFISFATEPARLAEQAALIAYGPMRKSALQLVGTHPILNVEMLGYLPTAPQNFGRALQFDEAWWRDNGQALSERLRRGKQRWRQLLPRARPHRKPPRKSLRNNHPKDVHAGCAPRAIVELRITDDGRKKTRGKEQVSFALSVVFMSC